MEAKKFMELTENLTVFVSRTDMAFRTLIPSRFDQQLVMEHDTPPFQYTRKFLVMTNDGFRYKSCFGRCKTPNVTKATAQRIMVKVIDMVECVALHDPRKNWKMVRVRWRGLDYSNDTWIDITRVNNNALLQEFYMASNVSWNLTALVTKTARYRYPTEEQLWYSEPDLDEWRSQWLSPSSQKENVSDDNTLSILASAYNQPLLEDNDNGDDTSSISSRESSRASQINAKLPSDKSNKSRSQETTTKKTQFGGWDRSFVRPHTDKDSGWGTPPNAPIIDWSNSSKQIATPKPLSLKKPTPQGNEKDQVQTAQPSIDTTDTPASREEPKQMDREPSPNNIGNDAAKNLKRGRDANNEQDVIPKHEAIKVVRRVSITPGKSLGVSFQDKQSGSKFSSTRKSPTNSSNKSTRGEQLPVDVQEKNSTDNQKVEKIQKQNPDNKNPSGQIVSTTKSQPLPLEAHVDLEVTSKESQIVLQNPTEEKSNEVTPEIVSSESQLMDENTTESQLQQSKSSEKNPSEMVKQESRYSVWRTSTLPHTKINCICGSTSPEEYTGDWIQCQTEACGTWFHSTCVDVTLSPFICHSCAATVSTESSEDIFLQLYRCCESNAHRRFQYLFESQKDVIKDQIQQKRFKPWNWNAVDCAASNGSLEILQLLLISGIEFTSEVGDIFLRNPLHLAIQNQHFKCIPSLASMNTKWLGMRNKFNFNLFYQYLQNQSDEALKLLQLVPKICHFVDDNTGDTIAHYICQILPKNSVSFVRAIPPSAFIGVTNKKGETAIMLAVKHSHFTSEFLEAIIDVAGPYPTWWKLADSNGFTIVHYAILMKHYWIFKYTDLSLLQGQSLLHLAAEYGPVDVVLQLLDANYSVTEPCAKTKLWPILLARHPEIALKLIQVNPAAQLQYMYDTRKNHDQRVQRFLAFVASHAPLFNYLQEIIGTNPDIYFSSKCLFFQRYRKCLRVDLKLAQLQYHCRQIPLATSRIIVRIRDEGQVWPAIQEQCGNIHNWFQRIVLEIRYINTSIAYYSSNEWYFWNLLSLELMRLGPYLFQQSSSNFFLLGRLLAHMVYMGQRLSFRIFPPSFLGTPPTFSAELAIAFKNGFSIVLPGLLDGWNGYELFFLFHAAEFPNTMEEWRTSMVEYEAPFSSTHPTIILLWQTVEKYFIQEEKSILRLLLGQPFKIKPAPNLMQLEKNVLGLPVSPNFLTLHSELGIFIRQFRKRSPE